MGYPLTGGLHEDKGLAQSCSEVILIEDRQAFLGQFVVADSRGIGVPEIHRRIFEGELFGIASNVGERILDRLDFQ